MDPPEEGKPTRSVVFTKLAHSYALGNVGKPEDMAAADDNLFSVACLKPNDICFVRRTDGTFTFAKVLSRQRGPEALIELQVDEAGATKTVPMNQCGKYVRLLHSSMSKHQKPLSRQYQPQRRPAARRPSGTLTQSFNTCRPGPGLTRQSSFKVGSSTAHLHSGLDPPQKQRRPQRQTNLKSSFQRRPVLYSQASCDPSFQSDLKDVHLRPDCGRRRSSVNSRLRSHPSLRSSIKTYFPEGKTRRSSIRSSTDTTQRSSWNISLSDPVDEFVSDIELSSPEEVESDSETSSKSDTDDETELRSASSSDDSDGSPLNLTSQDLVIKNTENFVMGSVERVSLPGGFDDLEFNEDSIRKAFHCIVSRSRTA